MSVFVRRRSGPVPLWLVAAQIGTLMWWLPFILMIGIESALRIRLPIYPNIWTAIIGGLIVAVPTYILLRRWQDKEDAAFLAHMQPSITRNAERLSALDGKPDTQAGSELSAILNRIEKKYGKRG